MYYNLTTYNKFIWLTELSYPLSSFIVMGDVGFDNITYYIQYITDTLALNMYFIFIVVMLPTSEPKNIGPIAGGISAVIVTIVLVVIIIIFIR